MDSQSGLIGAHAQSRVLMVFKRGHARVQIRHRPTVEQTVSEIQQRHKHVMKAPVQVGIWFIHSPSESVSFYSNW